MVNLSRNKKEKTKKYEKNTNNDNMVLYSNTYTYAIQTNNRTYTSNNSSNHIRNSNI